MRSPRPSATLADMLPNSAESRLIVAIDVDTLEKAAPLVDALLGSAGYFKVGLELISHCGAPQTVEWFKKRGARLFFDGKFNDIPNTVAQASRAISQLGVDFFDIHASAGKEAMRAAVANRGGSAVLAVTVLTALSAADCEQIFGRPLPVVIRSFVESAIEAGVQGVICSPADLKLLEAIQCPESFLKVTPGVRPDWAAVGDQKRTCPPKDAILAGATHLVVGRPILHPPANIGSSTEAAKRVTDEIAEALALL